MIPATLLDVDPSSSTPAWRIVAILAVLFYRGAMATLLAAFHTLPSIQRRRLLEEGAIASKELTVLLEHPRGLGMGLRLWSHFLLVVLLVLSWPLKPAIPGGYLSLALLTLLLLWGLDLAVPTLLTSANPEGWLTRLFPLYAPIHPLLMPILNPLAKRMDARAEEERAKEAAEETKPEAVTALIEEGEAEGILEQEDAELIRNVVSFGDTVVREVMTPRTRMVTVDGGATIPEAWQAFMHSRHGRLPVVDGSVDRITGVLLLKDLIQLPDHDGRRVRDLQKPIAFVPESKPVADLMRELQRRRGKMAIVVDEFGGVSGLATLEDLLEEVFGEIRDEHEGAPEIQPQADGSLAVSGQTHVEDLASHLGLTWERDGFDTVAGLLMARLGRIPKPGDAVVEDGVKLTVARMEGPRVNQVRVERLPAD
jgi:CBS domain containing-hemolysin-like protein